MKKISTLASSMLLAMGLLTTSCSNDESTDLIIGESADVEVSTMGKWLPTTRNNGIEENMPVLHFRNKTVYETTLKKLRDMTDQQRLEYYRNLGFEGAYSLWDKADKELEQIFDIEDSLMFEKSIAEYKEKYKGMFNFSQEDETDVTPLYKFKNTNLQLTGNINGFVVISDSLINSSPDLDDEDDGIDSVHYAPGVIPGPIQPTFQAYPKASLQTKNGRYTSTITMGHIFENRAYAVSVITKKKKLIRKKTVKTRHDVRLTISGQYSLPYYSILPEGVRVNIYDRSECFGNKNGMITFDVQDFHSAKCPTPVSGSFQLPYVIPF